jgi:hypothetical protein
MATTTKRNIRKAKAKTTKRLTSPKLVTVRGKRATTKRAYASRNAAKR